MKRAILAGILLLCAGCQTRPATSFFADAKFGLSRTDMDHVVINHGGTVEQEGDEGDLGAIIALMRGREMFGRELSPLVTIIFVHGRMKMFGIEYYLLPHQEQVFISNQRCGQIFTQVAGEITSVYGQPADRDGKPDGESQSVTWKWHPDGRYLYAYAYYDRHENRCGIIKAGAFDGSEAEEEKFLAEKPKISAP